jgi:AraC-like DNA-binding protein
MQTALRSRIAPSTAASPAVAALVANRFDKDAVLVSIPRVEFQVVVRFGSLARGGLDVHAFGARDHAHRKLIRGGHRAVTARLRLGATEAVFGVPACEIAGRIIPLDELWGDVATRRLCDRLAVAGSMEDAAAIIDSAVGERIARSNAAARPHVALALRATDRLTSASVSAVASELGVSERHLRRVFLETIGVNPKAFARLARFHRALAAARANRAADWASIAAATGYYDQAHLIGEFRAIADVTPSALLRELDAA